jgi:hypothetical protein
MVKFLRKRSKLKGVGWGVWVAKTLMSKLKRTLMISMFVPCISKQDNMCISLYILTRDVKLEFHNIST